MNVVKIALLLHYVKFPTVFIFMRSGKKPSCLNISVYSTEIPLSTFQIPH